METKCWLWPDHTISKRASRRLREEHNALVDITSDLLEAAEAVLKECCLVHRHWGENSNQTQANDADAALIAAIAKARGEA